MPGAPEPFRNFDYQYGSIAPSEYALHFSHDARHLVCARALMQEALRGKYKQIVTVWAPKHAERIADYIRRQTEFEAGSSISVNEPVDFRYVGPKEERKKMTVYGSQPLQRYIRVYEPTLPPLAYERWI